jgi:hypothetical protein
LSGIQGYSIDGGAYQTENEFVVSENGQYTFTAIDSAGNYTVQTETVNNIPSSIETIEQTKMKAYPNPAVANVRIEAEYPITSLVISDMQGRVVLDKKGTGTTETIDVAALPAGTYAIRIYVSSGYTDRKMIKK